MKIERLEPHQVFVFGTNRAGFHGAGAAGWAMRGDSRNNWREDEAFLKAIQAGPRDQERRGRWAVFGIARGLMMGREGMGYGIITIERPGHRRSFPLPAIRNQIVDLIEFAQIRSDLEFLMTEIGCGLAGYTAEEIKRECIDGHDWPANIILPSSFK